MNTYNAPIRYFPDFFSKEKESFFEYFKNLDWEDRTAARREMYFATSHVPYTYGTGEYARTYIPKDMDPWVGAIDSAMSSFFDWQNFELCFLNYYETQKQALGWHADDAESIDHTRPIAVVSVGAERQIWTKPIGGTADDVEKILLHNGSLLLMNAGMQHTHYHRIPKHDRPCGPRISLTYRGYKS